MTELVMNCVTGYGSVVARSEGGLDSLMFVIENELGHICEVFPQPAVIYKFSGFMIELLPDVDDRVLDSKCMTELLTLKQMVEEAILRKEQV